jgi:hypothetical protein
MAGYTDQELARLQLGWAIREQNAGPDDDDDGEGQGSVRDIKRKYRQRHRQRSEELFDERGFQ